MLKLSLKDITDDISTKTSLFCDNTHLGEAYAEYCKKVKTSWEEFIGLVTTMIDKDYDYLSDIDIIDPSHTYDDLVSIGEDIFMKTNHNIVSLSNSFLTIGDFCKYMAYLVMVDEGYSVTFPVFESDDSIVRDYSLTLDDVLYDINAIWHAITVDSAASETLSLTEGLSISERLSAFRDVISRTFSSAFDDVSGYLGRCQDMITNGLSAMDVWRENLKDDGVYDMANGTISYPSESINYEYHGVSPTSAYYWDTVADKISSTVVGIGTAIISGTNWLLRKGAKWISGLAKKTINIVQEKAIDPTDLEIINDQGNYTVDTTFSTNIFSVILNKNSVLYKDIVTKNKSIRIETKFSENIIQKVNHSSGVSYEKVGYFQNLIKAMKLWYLKENNIKEIEINDFDNLPNNLVDLAAGIINYNNLDSYNYNLSVIENFQNSRFKVYFNPVCVMDFIRLNFSNNEFSKVSLMCKTKYKPINFDIFYSILKYFSDKTPIEGFDSPDHMAIKLKPKAYELIHNAQDLYFTDVTNETGMYNSILASYILDTIFWGDAIGDYSYYIAFNRGRASNSDLNNSSLVGYYLEDIYDCAYESVTVGGFLSNFTNNVDLQWFMDTFDTEDALILGVPTERLPHDISFRLNSTGITNLDYFNLCSLTSRITTFNYQSKIDNIEISIHSAIQLPTLYELYIPKYSGNRGIISMLQLYFSAFVQESIRPLDFKFIPYTTGSIDFKNSMFRIRTDAENINEFNNFVTGIVAGVIVAALVVTSIVVIKSVIRKTLLLRNTSKRQIENKILNRENITNSDLKKYARYNRKQSKLSRIVGNSVHTSNILSNDNILDANDRIISLITG